MYQPVKSLATVAMLFVLAACQTTSHIREREVDPSETLIRFPVELNDLKGFKFKGAKIYSEGSYEVQIVYFTGGSYAYERYFFGGFHKVTKDNFEKRLKKRFEGATNISPIKTTNANVGLIHYATFERDGNTCFFLQSNYGSHLNFRTGTGTEGRTEGVYCAKGVVDGLEKEILQWVKKVRLDHK